jgi:alpha-beta hydrolase superfamily lysophospholipase
MEQTEIELKGHAGRIVAQRWQEGTPRYVALLVHGYGEHIGRYDHVARRLVADGAVVYGHDHVGHGRSAGDRVLVEEFEPVVEDVHLLEARARTEHPELPVALIGHSMGGMIAARYAQRFGDGLACVILSGPVVGSWAALEGLLAAPEIPDVPIDPSTLSRDASVGEAYVADPLVWHGPFKRPTLEAMKTTLGTIEHAGSIDRPLLWLHGEDDQLVPITGTRQGWASLKGSASREKVYPEARHEIFNETNRDEVLDDVIAFINEHLPKR